MGYLYLSAGIVLLLVGYAFLWMAMNSPMQSRIWLALMPAGAVLSIIGLARVLP